MDGVASLIFHGCLWLSYILYLACFVPQIITNYKLKSTAGVSNTTIFVHFTGYFIEIWYAFYCNLPLELKILIPAGAVVALALAVQRFKYATDRKEWSYLFILYGAITLLWMALGIGGVWFPCEVGTLCGWIGAAMWTWYQLPQVRKMYTQRHSYGFNPWVIAMMLVAGIGEAAAGFGLSLPLQTKYNGVRGVIFSLILMILHYVHRERTARKERAAEKSRNA